MLLPSIGKIKVVQWLGENGKQLRTVAIVCAVLVCVNLLLYVLRIAPDEARLKTWGPMSTELRMRHAEAVLFEEQKPLFAGLLDGIPVQKDMPLLVKDLEQMAKRLNLAVAASLAAAMAGSISVRSAPGGGTRFDLELPTATAPAVLSHAAARTSTGGARLRTIVYIEDNLANLRLVERLLADRPGGRLLAAMRGRSGLTLTLEEQPDLVLLDFNLPDMSGAEVLAAMRAAPQSHAVPVVVLSSSSEPDIQRRILELGADAVLLKPIDVRRLLATVDRLLGASESANG